MPYSPLSPDEVAQAAAYGAPAWEARATEQLFELGAGHRREPFTEASLFRQTTLARNPRAMRILVEKGLFAYTDGGAYGTHVSALGAQPALLELTDFGIAYGIAQIETRAGQLSVALADLRHLADLPESQPGPVDE